MNETSHGGCCSGQPRLKAAVVIIGVVLLAGIIVTALLRDRLVQTQYKSVTVMGQGRVSYNPDIAVISLGVQIDKAAQPEVALNQLNARVAAIIAAVQREGVGAESIQTANYSLYPQYDYRDNVSSVSGYNANQQLTIKVLDYGADQSKLSRIIAAASQAGANQVNSLTFDYSRLEELKQQARLAAIADASEKSRVLAETAGVELKEVIGWYESYNPQPYYDMGLGRGGEQAASAPVTPAGAKEVILEMGVTYSLK